MMESKFSIDQFTKMRQGQDFYIKEGKVEIGKKQNVFVRIGRWLFQRGESRKILREMKVALNNAVGSLQKSNSTELKESAKKLREIVGDRFGWVFGKEARREKNLLVKELKAVENILGNEEVSRPKEIIEAHFKVLEWYKEVSAPVNFNKLYTRNLSLKEEKRWLDGKMLTRTRVGNINKEFKQLQESLPSEQKLQIGQDIGKLSYRLNELIDQFSYIVLKISLDKISLDKISTDTSYSEKIYLYKTALKNARGAYEENPSVETLYNIADVHCDVFREMVKRNYTLRKKYPGAKEKLNEYWKRIVIETKKKPAEKTAIAKKIQETDKKTKSLLPYLVRYYQGSIESFAKEWLDIQWGETGVNAQNVLKSMFDALHMPRLRPDHERYQDFFRLGNLYKEAGMDDRAYEVYCYVFDKMEKEEVYHASDWFQSGVAKEFMDALASALTIAGKVKSQTDDAVFQMYNKIVADKTYADKGLNTEIISKEIEIIEI